MSKLSSKKRLENFKNTFATLLSEFYDAISLFSKKDVISNIPEAPVYEFQHAIVHLGHTYKSIDKEFQIKQYELACAHIERGILDARKLLLFNIDTLENKRKENNHIYFQNILETRIKEYNEIKSRTEQGTTPTCRSIYAELCKDLSGKQPIKLIKNRPDITTEELMPAVIIWTKFELILSSLEGEKDLVILTELIKLLSNSNTSKADIEKSTGKIALRVINCFKFLNLIAFLGKNPQRDDALSMALKKYNENGDATDFIQVCKIYFLNPFCNISNFLDNYFLNS